MSEDKKPVEQEVLIEKVREIEAQKAQPGEAEEDSSVILGEKKRLGPSLDDSEAGRQMRGYSRRGFLIGGASAVFGCLGYWWLKKPENGGIFESALRWNEGVSQDYFSPKHLAPEFSRELAREPRANGDAGLTSALDETAWRLSVGGLAAAEGLILNLDDLKRLPRVEMTTQLKCIEGWSVIVNWAGVRFSDFAAFVRPLQKKYVSLVTPDGGYYVGWDMPSIMHPQTLLAYEMNGAPLTPEHGAPLRLVTTVKYGIKQIKRIGSIEFTDERPADFWAERGYDWYSGH
ncbi:MAG: molybdopterin-dependent oxidoreductase [Pyrinomonadaceae bacterium]